MREQKRLCKDCAYYPRCQRLIGSVNERSVECDWTSSRWKPSEAYRLTIAEQERDSLKQQITELDKSTDDLQFKVKAVERLVGVLEKKLAERDAACADMRGALELGKDVVSVFAQFVPDHIRDAKKHIEFINTANHALSSSAGKDLLERMREAERLLKAVSEDLSVPYPGNLRTVMAKLRNGSALILEDLEDDYHNEGYNQVRQSMTMLRNLKTAIDAYLERGNGDA